MRLIVRVGFGLVNIWPRSNVFLFVTCQSPRIAHFQAEVPSSTNVFGVWGGKNHRDRGHTSGGEGTLTFQGSHSTAPWKLPCGRLRFSIVYFQCSKLRSRWMWRDVHTRRYSIAPTHGRQENYERRRAGDFVVVLLALNGARASIRVKTAISRTRSARGASGSLSLTTTATFIHSCIHHSPSGRLWCSGELSAARREIVIAHLAYVNFPGTWAPILDSGDLLLARHRPSPHGCRLRTHNGAKTCVTITSYHMILRSGIDRKVSRSRFFREDTINHVRILELIAGKCTTFFPNDRVHHFATLSHPLHSPPRRTVLCGRSPRSARLPAVRDDRRSLPVRWVDIYTACRTWENNSAPVDR